ncbi:MAG: hypothetical protein ACO1SV_13975 [Fimbriimonas sp.]
MPLETHGLEGHATIFPMTKSPGDLLRAEIKRRVWPYLREHGFTAFTALRAWRYGPRWVDLVEFEPYNHSDRVGWTDHRRQTEIWTHGDSFGLTVGTHYTDVRLLPWVTKTVEKPKGRDIDRTVNLHRPIDEADVPGSIFWRGADAGIDEALATLESRGLRYLDRFHDVAAFLEQPDPDQDSDLLDQYLDEAGLAQLAALEARYPDRWWHVVWDSAMYHPFAAAVERLRRANALPDSLEAMEAIYRNMGGSAGILCDADGCRPDPLFADKIHVADRCIQSGADWSTLLKLHQEFHLVVEGRDRQIKAGNFQDRFQSNLFFEDFETNLRTAFLLHEGRSAKAIAYYRSRCDEPILRAYLDDWIQQLGDGATKRDIKWQTTRVEEEIQQGQARIAMLEAAYP